MSQQVLLKVSGLATHPNHLSSVPAGALLKANNIVINRDNIGESRRGFKIYGSAMGNSSTTTAHQLFTYKNRLFRHYGPGAGTTIDYDSDGAGAFADFSFTLSGTTHGNTTVDGFTTTSLLENGMLISGANIPANTTIVSISNNNSIIISNSATGSSTSTFTFAKIISEVQTGVRIKDIEQNSNLYFTSSQGIQKISAATAADLSTAIITNAGGIKALDLEATINNAPGFFLEESVIAYRLVWGLKDANQNLILGAPSNRAVIYNSATPLIINDFNALLAKLDTLNLSTGIKAQDYVATYKVPSNANASTTREALINLTSGIDGDIDGFSVTGATYSGSGPYPVVLTVSSDPTSVLRVGDAIEVFGVVNSPVSPNAYNSPTDPQSYYTITAVDATTVSYTATTIPGTYASAGTVKRRNYENIALPAELSLTPTTDQLLSLQAYYNNIVTALQNENSGVVADTSTFNSSNAIESATTNLTFVVPRGVTTAHFYQLYRTAPTVAASGTSLSSYDPGDEEQLVFEDNPSLADLNNGIITIHDVTPDSFRGANLYTNPNTGDGILQANDIPPLAQDITAFKGYAFYGNTRTKQKLSLSLLSVSQLTSGVSTITISDGTISNTYTFVLGVAQIQTVSTVADIAGSLNNTYFLLSNGANTTSYYIWYNNGTGIDPAIDGATSVEVAYTNGDSAASLATATANALQAYGDFSTSVSTNTITITNTSTGISTQASNGTPSPGFSYAIVTPGQGEDAPNKKVLISSLPTPSQQVDETAKSFVRVINRNSSEIVNGFYLSGSTDVPGLILLEDRALSGVKFFLTANSTTTGEQFSPTIPTSGTSYNSDNEVKPNRLYYSKYQQPEAVPLLNYVDIGPQDKSILRILALRDNLFILKEEGIYRLSGLSAPFSLSLFDSSTLIKGGDSAVVLNNQIYMYSSQGVATISDTGVSVISRPIENLLTALDGVQYPNFYTATFGVSYESDRSYYLFTVTNFNDTIATQCFRYNTFTSSWTILNLTKRSAVVNSFDDKLYLGAGDTNFIEQERKSFDRTDYSDRELALSLGSNAVNGTTITFPSLAKVQADDILVQTQYLTMKQYNTMLTKLDTDRLLTDGNYVSLLTLSPGVNLSNAVDSLITKIANDSGRVAVPGSTLAATYLALTPTGAAFSAQQTTFNNLIALLNNDVGIGYKNYIVSSSTTDYEFNIISINTNNNTIVAPYVYPLIQGPFIVYNHINVELLWSPQYFQDVSMTKQVSEGTLIFEDSSFSVATLSYATDLSANFEDQDINGFGNGIFGNFPYGEGLYGGDGSGIPFRTYLPKEKQRCRYVNVKFEHSIGRESFALYGLSLTYSVLSQRGWR